MNYIVVYPGRFHPFHRGHRASYDWLANKWGEANVYIATSDVQAPVTSPFSYEDKVAMMSKLGIPTGHIVRVKNPYQAQEIISNLPDPENTALIFAVSEKDMSGPDARFKFGTKKNGEPSYMQPMPENNKKMQPLTKHAYVEITPTVNFKIKGKDANSASEIRKVYTNGNESDRDQIIADLYGEVYPDIRDIFDKKLGVTQKIQELVYGAEIKDNNSMNSSAPLKRESREKLAQLLETINRQERLILKTYSPIQEDIYEDYIEERYSQGLKKNKPHN
jgi:hypothetical protein